MLILSRRQEEAIIISGNIRVINLGLNKWGQVRFGIEAPPNVEVHREEIYWKIVRGEPYHYTSVIAD